MNLERENQYFEHEPLAAPFEVGGRPEYEFRCVSCGGMDQHDPACPETRRELPGFPSAAVPPGAA